MHKVFVLFSLSIAHERRQLLVALLPNVKKLNGGAPIGNAEREDAERAFIRRYVIEEAEKPERCTKISQFYKCFSNNVFQCLN